MNPTLDYTYLDHNATTYVDPLVLEAMLPYWGSKFANPSSIYDISQDVRADLDAARTELLSLLGATTGKVIFTGGGSESDNLAIKGFARANEGKGSHIITSAIEHHAVGHTCEFLEKHGFEITYVPVTNQGVINMEAFEAAIRPDTILVSVMAANNETGVIQPLEAIGKITKTKGITFHTDAVQIGGKLKIDVDAWNVDLLTLSAHKFYGPKGIGCLYVRKGVRIQPQIHGGSQELGLRAGTENVAASIGMVRALWLATESMETESRREQAMRDRLEAALVEQIPEVMVNGAGAPRLPNTLNIITKYIEGEGMLLYLNMNKIYASSGSACTSGSLDPSHVLLAMGIPHEYAHGSLRFSFGRSNTEEDVEKVIALLPGIVRQLRSMSPLWPENK